jgi:predicted acyl esterase
MAFEYRWLQGTAPTHPHDYRYSVEDGMVIERDAAAPMRDGVRIFTDIFRPQSEAPAPALIAWAPYGKHSPRGTYERFDNFGGVDKAWVSKYAAFEAPDPLYWTRHGYAVVNVDPRGLWHSEGNATFWSADEAKDVYDLIEWLAKQPWCNGKVGMSGVSYLAIVQWQVAALNPPHLAAINPYEGYSDSYRERARHGGIPEHHFMNTWLKSVATSKGKVEDVRAMIDEHPFYDEYWQSKAPDLSKISVPAYVVASWCDQGLHTRGTIEGFRQMSSKHKWLEVHSQKKWQYFMRPENVERQRAFFDHFLRGSSDEVLSWPKVRIEVRESLNAGRVRGESEWPIARTKYTPLYLDAGSKNMAVSRPSTETEARYDAKTGEALFDHRFAADTEVSGYMKLKLWVETTEGDDLDLFVIVRKLDGDGREVPFTFFAVFQDGPVALGWLRVSHRELDAARSTPWQPWLRHGRELPVKPGEILPVEIEILPSSTLFRKGETLRIAVLGRDSYEPKVQGPVMRHGPLRNAGEHVLHTGGRYDAHLLVPVVPEKEER